MRIEFRAVDMGTVECSLEYRPDRLAERGQ